MTDRASFSTMPSIQNLLAQAAQVLAATSESPVLDAEVLLCHVLQQNRPFLRAWCDKNVGESESAHFQKLCGQRQQGHPIAYLVGQREFWSRDFLVNPAVLIPRPDTELLIELALPLIPLGTPCQILDLGTGSGIIGITLAAERPKSQVVAADFSLSALAVAQANANHHQLVNIRFYHSDWFNSLPPQRFQIIVSNPPYIAPDDTHLQQGDIRFEPQSALIAAKNGLQDIQTITRSAKNWLAANGCLLIEHGYDQETAVQALFIACGYQNVQTHKDLSGQPRVTSGTI